MSEIRLVIKGRPMTKKNSPRVFMIGKYPKVLPSKAYVTYEKDAVSQLTEHFKMRLPKVDKNVQIQAFYWLPDRKGKPDMIGLMQATADILETAQVIVNDSQVINWDGTRMMGYDKNNPRAEITIRILEDEFQPEKQGGLF
jgi:Holliday junction resolvase